MGKNVATATSKELILSLIKKKVKRIAIYLLLLMFVGTTMLMRIEDLDFIHALYCTSITITSSGTEKCFSTKLGRGFAIVWIILGAICKSYTCFTFTKAYTKIKQQSILKNETTTTELKPPEKKKDRGDNPKGVKGQTSMKEEFERLDDIGGMGKSEIKEKQPWRHSLGKHQPRLLLWFGVFASVRPSGWPQPRHHPRDPRCSAESKTGMTIGVIKAAPEPAATN
ncbi:hypothetical protein OSB04_001641 [Centaurea solstitialis]|uniref:Potassium channel domain-containing protein n=1 Tax=Centaurea solstitialis TaxID=347529 RepID=A0AA38U327_9ASTR|nr:hypothetical protein OSB04_001641 [Centaurea solstitialis]